VSSTPSLVDRGREILAGPDGPIAASIVLGLEALVQIALLMENEDDRATAMILSLIAIAPRRRLLLSAWSVTILSCLVLVSNPGWVTLGVLGAQLGVAYLVAAERSRRASLLLAVPVLLSAVTLTGSGEALTGVGVLVLVVAAQVLGDARRQQGEAIAERDATRQAIADSLREQAALEERARIARELHDVVAHHVSMVAVQADTARLATPGMPEEGRDRLAAIGDTAREALTEMRRLLGVLRADAGEPARAPQPGLDDLPALLDHAREAGTEVHLTRSGRAVPLSPGVDLTAYRIVQEALTNARRHAPGANVAVELRFPRDSLFIRVRDDGPGPPTPEPDGHGLLGMRERAAMVGGTLRARAAPRGGFAIEAELPIGGEA
jgi:signal transduction histidine kinase